MAGTTTTDVTEPIESDASDPTPATTVRLSVAPPALTLVVGAIAAVVAISVLEDRTRSFAEPMRVADWILAMAIVVGAIGVLGVAVAVRDRYRLASELARVSTEAEGARRFLKYVASAAAASAAGVDNAATSVDEAAGTRLLAEQSARQFARTRFADASLDLATAVEQHDETLEKIDGLLPAWIEEVDTVLWSLGEARARAARKPGAPGVARADAAWTDLAAARNELVVDAALRGTHVGSVVVRYE